MRSNGYSLWLVPDREPGRRLAARIAALARLCGTEPFEPHVTLLGGIARPERDLLEAARALAVSLAPVTIRLGPLAASDEPFKCVFARAEPTLALRAARTAIAEALGIEGGPFEPHLSLVYGRLEARVRSAALRQAASCDGAQFLARRLQLVLTEGLLREWRFVAAWPLEGSRRPATRAPRRTRGAAAGRRSRPRPPRRRTTGSRPRRRKRSSPR